MRPRFAGQFALWALIGAALAGCETTPKVMVECSTPVDKARTGPALVGVQYGMQISPIPLNSVLWTDANAVKNVALQSLFAGRTPGETVQVTARFVNCSDDSIQLRARTSFMDASQAPTEQPTIWKPVYLAPRSTGVYTELSIGRSAVSNYLIEISSGL